MGLKSGDKAKHYRERRKRIARRASMRALRAQLQNQAPAKSAAAAPTATS